MKFRWPLVLGIFLLLSLLPAIRAEEAFSASYTAIKDSIDYNGTASYTVIIQNNQDIVDSVRMGYVAWGTVFYDPSDFTLSPHSTARINVRVIPPRDVRIGTYAIDVPIISETDNIKKGSVSLRLNVVTELPKLEPTFGIPNEIEPGILKLNVMLQNTGAEAVEGISAKLESKFLEPVEMNLNNFGFKETKLIYDKEIEIPSTTSPGIYDIKLDVYQNGQILSKYVKQIQILGKENIVVDDKVEKSLLGEGHIVTIQNTGNIEANKEFTVDRPSWNKFLVSGIPKQTSVSSADGKVRFAWAYSLAPGATYALSYKISYVPLAVILIIALIVLSSLMWYYRREFTLTKEVASGKEAKALKIKLTIKNTKPVEQKNVVVEDYIPTPLKLVKEFTTVTPAAIKKEAGVVKIIWKFDSIEGKGERVLSYGIRSTLGIVGMVLLPAAKLKVKINKVLKVFLSNKLSIKGKVQIAEEEEE